MPCKKFAIRGGTVCRTHGGASPQVKRKAEDRLRDMVDPMINRLSQLALQTDDLQVAAKCVIDALDRAGIGEVVQAKIRSSQKATQDKGSGLTVNIGFLQVANTQSPSLPTYDALPAIEGTVEIDTGIPAPSEVNPGVRS